MMQPAESGTGLDTVSCAVVAKSELVVVITAKSAPAYMYHSESGSLS
jgi:hypothetical protein